MQSTPFVTPPRQDAPRKPEELVGVCFLVWKLHHKNGLVHKQGHRHTPCVGSHKPPIETPIQATRRYSAPVKSPPAVTRPPTTITPVSNDDLHPLPSSFTINTRHPFLQSKLLRHIPKAAINCTCQLLTNIINRLLSDPMRPEHWRCLFCSAALTLAKP